MPASRDTITYFAVSMGKALSPATIQVYVAAVGAAHRERGVQDPTRDNHRLRSVLKGIRRQHTPQSRRRHPITPSILSKMLQAISSCKDLTSFDRRMLIHAGLSRLLTCVFTKPANTRFNPRLHTSPRHITLHRHHYTFYLSHSKTDQFFRGHTLHITQTRTSSCPVRHMKAYLRAGWKWHGPLFVLKDGASLTRKRCLQYLRYSLKHSAYNPMNVNTHSFRIGAATAAAHSGLKQKTIQQLERWSKAVQTYIRPYPTTSN